MALHKPPLEIPFVHLETGFVTEPWSEWLISNYRDKADKIEDGTEGDIVIVGSDGDSEDSGVPLPSGDVVGTTDTQTLTNKTLTSPTVTGGTLTSSTIVTPTITGGTQASPTITTPTITVPVIADLSSMTHDHKSSAKGGDYPWADIVIAATQADAVTTHSVTDPSDSPVSADALRDDLVTNTIPSIEGMLNALGTIINALIDKLQTAKLMT